MRYAKNKKPLVLEQVADDLILRERATVQSFQRAYHERDFALHAPGAKPR
jgi:hypothetical protein